MATTPTSSSSASSSAQSIIASMGLGSGVDVKNLAQSLVNASRDPLQEAINKKISKSEARISGYGAISYILSDLKAKFSALNSTAGFNALNVSNSQPSSFTARVSGNAANGNHAVTVVQLAQGQRSMSSSGYGSPDDVLPDTTVNLTIGGNTLSASVSAGDTVSDLVAAINAEMGSAGIKAQLINRGAAANPANAPHFLVISGPSGADQSFTVSGLGMGNPPLQEAQNALLEVDNIAVQSSSNTVVDAIPGVTLQLTGVSPAVDANTPAIRTPASLALVRDTSAIQTKVKALVTSFNDVNSVLNAAADPKSQVEGYGGTLSGDSTVSLLRNQIRNLMFGESSTPAAGSSVRGLRDLGISLDSAGNMTLDENQLTNVLSSRFDDVVQMMSASRETPTTIRSIASGLAGDAVKRLDDMLISTAPLGAQSKNAQAEIARYRSDLEKLNMRMDKLLERYNKQFSAMEALLSQTNSLKTSLKNSFDGMMASYTQK